VAASLPGFAAAPEADPQRLEGLVARWVALRQELAAAGRRWEQARAILESERDLLVQEKARLANPATAHRPDAAGLHERLDAATADRDRSAGRLAAFCPSLVEAETRLADLLARLPEFLQSQLTSRGAELGRRRNPPAPDDVVERTQRVVGLLGEVEQLNAGINTGSAVLTGPDGTAREMDVLFVGLGAGYAVSRDGRLAAVGRMTDTGWVWTWPESGADDIRRAMAIFRKDQPAGFVPLPVTVEVSP